MVYLGSTKLKASTNCQKFFLGGIQWNDLSDFKIIRLKPIEQYNWYISYLQTGESWVMYTVKPALNVTSV